MSDGWRVKANHNHYLDGIEVFIRLGEDGFVEPFTIMKREQGEMISPSVAAEFGQGFLRAALNAAWEIGLRPDGFNDTRESMKATNAHLQDMRALAFHKIGAQKP